MLLVNDEGTYCSGVVCEELGGGGVELGTSRERHAVATGILPSPSSLCPAFLSLSSLASMQQGRETPTP